MRTVAVIIDFDNYFGSDVSKLSPESMEFSFSEIVNLCEIKFAGVEYVNIRLYGGWYKETSLTKQASSLQQILYNVNVFPKVKDGKIIKGEIEMVSSLHDIPEFTWGHTHKETDGIKRVRINHECVDDLCNGNRENCPKFILYKFTDKKDKKCAVSGCENVQKNVFKGVEQKMVDTIIACDVLSMADNDSIHGLILISDDQDHFPSLALAKRKQELKQERNLEGVILGIRNEQKLEFVANFLKPFNIDTILLS